MNDINKLVNYFYNSYICYATTSSNYQIINIFWYAMLIPLPKRYTAKKCIAQIESNIYNTCVCYVNISYIGYLDENILSVMFHFNEFSKKKKFHLYIWERQIILFVNSQLATGRKLCSIMGILCFTI